MLFISFSVSAQFQLHGVSFFFLQVVLPCAHPPMPASPDPRNTFEVTVPPHFGEDQTFSFTFHPVFPGPVVSFLCLMILLNLYTPDAEHLYGPVSDCPSGSPFRPRLCACPTFSNSKAFDLVTRLCWCLTEWRSRCAEADLRLEGGVSQPFPYH